MPHGLPDYLEPGAPPYGETYPLDLIAGDHTAPPRPSSGVPRAQQAAPTASVKNDEDDEDGPAPGNAW